ncbi:MAG: SsrA-binding protein SmpB [bacterium]|nr:SsrA-binding protein SmpB [bacterium]
MEVQILVENKKARLNYELGDKYEAGVELLGLEVKSLRQKLGSLEGSYMIIRGGEAFLINSFIPPYQEKNAPKEYDPRRNRKLLLSKKELYTLANLENGKNLTIVPTLVYNVDTKIKVEIRIAKGKKQYDKRDSIKKRETDREIDRTLKNR